MTRHEFIAMIAAMFVGRKALKAERSGTKLLTAIGTGRGLHVVGERIPERDSDTSINVQDKSGRWHKYVTGRLECYADYESGYVRYKIIKRYNKDVLHEIIAQERLA